MAGVKGSADLLIEVARKELGTVEGPRDNETKYGKFTGTNFLPWCGAFVMWCANKAGVTIPNVVGTLPGAQAFMKKKRWYPAPKCSPERGDLAFFDFPHDGIDRISHVGIVVKDNGDGTCVTIEGNTAGTTRGNQRNGGMVAKKVRAYKANKKKIPVSIVGFGRPKFIASSKGEETK